MNRLHIVTSPVRLTDLKFDEFDFEDKDDWMQRARRLQARRWRQISNQIKSNPLSRKFKGGKVL